MSLNVGSLLSSVGLPNLNLGSIGSDILTEGKNLLGEVVKDSFSLSSQPGQTFASSMNLDVGGKNLSLPNPVGALANKLLGGVDSELNQVGVNVNFQQLAEKLFHLPAPSGGSVSVPSVASRTSTATLPTSPQAAVSSTMGVGGGGTVTTGAVSSGPITGSQGSENAILGALGTAATSENSALQEFQNLGDPSSPNYQYNLAKAQMDMQAAEQGMQMMSQILQMMNQTAMGIIGNIK